MVFLSVIFVIVIIACSENKDNEILQEKQERIIKKKQYKMKKDKRKIKVKYESNRQTDSGYQKEREKASGAFGRRGRDLYIPYQSTS